MSQQGRHGNYFTQTIPGITYSSCTSSFTKIIKPLTRVLLANPNTEQISGTLALETVRFRSLARSCGVQLNLLLESNTNWSSILSHVVRIAPGETSNKAPKLAAVCDGSRTSSSHTRIDKTCQPRRVWGFAGATIGSSEVNVLSQRDCWRLTAVRSGRRENTPPIPLIGRTPV